MSDENLFFPFFLFSIGRLNGGLYSWSGKQVREEKKLSGKTCLQTHSLPRLRAEWKSGVLAGHRITPSRWMSLGGHRNKGHIAPLVLPDHVPWNYPLLLLSRIPDARTFGKTHDEMYMKSENSNDLFLPFDLSLSSLFFKLPIVV